jgi:hypothetical protein
MGREDLDVVRQLEQLAVDALVELLRERGFCTLSEQIGPAHAAREERIAGEHEPGLGPSGLPPLLRRRFRLSLTRDG